MENMRHYLSALNQSDALFLGRRFQRFLSGGPGEKIYGLKLNESWVHYQRLRIHFDPRNTSPSGGKGTRTKGV